MKGSCLCGTVQYEATRLAGPIVHCHCRTCRKAHSAAFTSTARADRASDIPSFAEAALPKA